MPRLSSAGSLLYGLFRHAADGTRSTLFSGRPRRPLYESTLLDDFLFAQPLNVACRWERWRARGRSILPGVTVIIVNYNTLPLIKTVVASVRQLSPPGTRIIVVDNASTDGSRNWLQSRPYGAEAVLLPTNVGHGRALDIGVYRSTTSVFVTLDSDAFPYSKSWIDMLLKPLEDPNVMAAGCWGRRDRLHPACSIYRRDAFFASGQSFANFNLHVTLGEDPDFGRNTWDTGERLSEVLGREAIVLMPVSPTDTGGITMAGVVYHHAAMTTMQTDDTPPTRAGREAAWEAAVSSLLPDRVKRTPA